jgi:hypothetical protein
MQEHEKEYQEIYDKVRATLEGKKVDAIEEEPVDLDSDPETIAELQDEM